MAAPENITFDAETGLYTLVDGNNIYSTKAANKDEVLVLYNAHLVKPKPVIKPRIKPKYSDSYIGNGTEQNIICGFRPSRVKIYSDDNKYIIRKFGNAPTKGMGRMRTGNAGAALRGLTITSGGITFTDTGFTIGDNDAVNKNNEIHHWEAFE